MIVLDASVVVELLTNGAVADRSEAHSRGVTSLLSFRI